jgi:long-chain acyl-CoA synthetase
MTDSKLILDYVFEHEKDRADHVWLAQPTGDGAVVRYTWREVLSQARRMASHLRSMGFAPDARIAILTKNCAHFMIAELAIWLAGFTTVAIFPTETASTVRYVLEHSEASLLFVGKLDSWGEQMAAVDARLPCIALPLAPTLDRGLGAQMPRWDDLIDSVSAIAPVPRKADDLAMIIYTSGSTGTPKGVMHAFGPISEAAVQISARIQQGVGEIPLRMLSYLPLAHVVERSWVQCTSMIVGVGTLYFTQSLETFVEDLKRAKPTVFVSVPRLWLKFQQGVHAKMSAGTLSLLLRIPIVGKLIGRKVLTGLGLEHVRMAGSGSAPITVSLMQWYRSLGLNLLEGYGMSEDFAYSNSSALDHFAPNYVGLALPGVQVRIADDGEILIKSPGKFVGYFKQPELYAQSFDADGFFQTGDLGELRADGLLKITGRKKELFKTAKGKYVSPAPIENLLGACRWVDAALVSGVGQQAPYGLIMLNEEARAHSHDSNERLTMTHDFAQLLRQINSDLADYEQLRMLVIAKEPWSIANGCLTPTLKIKRSQIEKMVSSSLEQWYESNDTVIWQQ